MLFFKNHIEVWSTYKKLYILTVYNLMSFGDECTLVKPAPAIYAINVLITPKKCFACQSALARFWMKNMIRHGVCSHGAQLTIR